VCVRIVIDFPDDLIESVKKVLVMDKPEYVKGFILEAVQTKVRISNSAKLRANRKRGTME
jgi:hypothetical protein